MQQRFQSILSVGGLALMLAAGPVFSDEPKTATAPATQPAAPTAPATRPAPRRPEPPPLCHYQKTGSGDTLVLLHGLGSDSSVWSGVVEALKDRFTVVTIDLRGHGQTPPQKNPARLHIQNLAQQDVRRVIEEENLGRVILVGHSMGGVVALEYARRYGNFTRMAVLVDTALQFGIDPTARDAMVNDLAADREAFIEKFFASAGMSKDPATSQRMAEAALKTDAETYAAFFKEYLDTKSNWPRKFGGTTTPVRLIYQQEARKDQPTAEYLSALGYDTFKNFRAERLENVGHFVMLDDQAAFLKALDDCIADLPKPIELADAGFTDGSSGLKYKDLVVGSGATPGPDARVKLIYQGWFPDGDQLFKTPDPANPTLFALNQPNLMPGVRDGVAGMKVGGERRIIVPPEMQTGMPMPNLGKHRTPIVMNLTLVESTEPPALPPIDASTEVTLPSGVKYVDLVVGDGPAATSASFVKVHYRWWLPNGRFINESSLTPDAPPQSIALERVAQGTELKGVVDAIAGMKVGGRRIATIPPELGYGPNEKPPIPANSTLVFEFELVEAVTPPEFQLPTETELTTTPSGLKYKDLKVGDGATPSDNSRVSVHYVGWLTNGTRFDSSYQKGRAADFMVNGVIKGWTEGVSSMKAGGRRILIVPPELGYGESPPPGSSIPPNSVLVFDIELLNVTEIPRPEPPPAPEPPDQSGSTDTPP